MLSRAWPVWPPCRVLGGDLDSPDASLALASPGVEQGQRVTRTLNAQWRVGGAAVRDHDLQRGGEP